MNLEWRNHFGGEPWAVTDRGLIVINIDTAKEIQAETPYVFHILETGCERVAYLRTSGTPYTMRTIDQDYGGAILAGAEDHTITPALIATTIAREATRVKGAKYHRDNQCERYESRLGEYSAGLMQTLVSTANSMNRKHKMIDGLLDRFDLYSPETSIQLGAAYYAHGVEEYVGHDDPVILQAGYNAGWGSLNKSSDRNRWKLRVHGEFAVEKFMAYYNDWMERNK